MCLWDFNSYCYEHILSPVSMDTQSLNFHLQYHPKIFHLPHQMRFTQKLNKIPDVQVTQHTFYKTFPCFLIINSGHLRRGEESELIIGMKNLAMCFTEITHLAIDPYVYTWFIKWKWINFLKQVWWLDSPLFTKGPGSWEDWAAGEA